MGYEQAARPCRPGPVDRQRRWRAGSLLGGQIIGKVDWFTVSSWGRANTSACWEVAIGIFAQYRGQGHGTQAQKMLVDYLFTHYPRHRIQATTAAENAAEQKCLEKLGFTREGVIRQAQWRRCVA
ncbi:MULTISPECIES: GNAT family protein [Actinomycetes]|uniref:GNAT family N-acetyltransferase n=1 Tax=Actinomycetes TaxID=1760 RepID=UPI00341304E0